MAYTTAEAREELLDAVASAAESLGLCSACLAEAYEALDSQSADRLEEECFRPVQLAFGRAKRCHSGFAERHSLSVEPISPPSAGLPSQGAAGFVSAAVSAVAAADHTLAELQDSMLPVEAGDEQLRADLRAVREPLDGFGDSARQFLRGLGR